MAFRRHIDAYTTTSTWYSLTINHDFEERTQEHVSTNSPLPLCPRTIKCDNKTKKLRKQPVHSRVAEDVIEKEFRNYIDTHKKKTVWI